MVTTLIPELRFSGRVIRRLMRQHGVTIRGLALQHGLTMKRVREVRCQGAKAGFASNEWHWLITGKWLEDLPAKDLQRLQATSRQADLEQLADQLSRPRLTA